MEVKCFFEDTLSVLFVVIVIVLRMKESATILFLDYC